MLADSDRTTIRRARRLVARGRAAEDRQTARVAMALAHQAEEKALGPGGAFLIVVFGLVAFAWCLAGDGPLHGTASRALAGALGAWMVVGGARQDRVARGGAPRAEMANRAFLKATGQPYERVPESAGIRIAPVGLVVVFLAYVVPCDLAAGVFLAGLHQHGSPGLGTIVADGAPLAIVTAAGSMLRSRHAWRPDTRPLHGGRWRRRRRRR